MSVELIAFCAVGNALKSLSDPEARIRVLHWANDRFGPDSSIPLDAPLTAAEVMAPPAVTALRLAPSTAPELELELPLEAALSVEGLDHLFEGSANQPVASVAEIVSMAPAQEDSVLLQESFAVPEDSFELLAGHEVAPGGDEDLSDVYEPPSEPVRPQLHLVTREEQPFDLLVDEFVDSLRCLTRDCLGS